MSDFDRRLRQRLTDQASGVAPSPDLEDLVERIARDRSRGRRIATAALALVVIAGPIAGFAVARASQGSSVRTADRREPPPPTTTSVGRFAPTRLPKIEADAVPFAAQSDKVLAATRAQALSDRALLANGAAVTLGRMFARTSAAGIEMRVYGAVLPAPASAASPCVPDRLVQVDASDALVSGVAQGYLLVKPPNRVFATVGFVGVSETSPIWIAVVQSDTGSSVRATFADGTTDSTALTKGLGVVGHTVAASTAAATLDQQPLRVELLDAAGRVIARVSVTALDSALIARGLGAPSAGC